MATGKGQGSVATSANSITLAELQTMCKYHGWRDTTTEGIAALTRYINNTMNILSQLAPWPEYLKRDGSVAMAADTYEYTLDETGIDRIGAIVRADNSLPLDELSIEDWLSIHTNTVRTGRPDRYATEPTVSMALKLLVYPTPTTVETLSYTYYRRPVEMVNTTDYADWPLDRVWLLEEALEKRLSAGKKDTTGWSLHNADFMQKVYTALGNARSSYKPIRVSPRVGVPSEHRIRDGWFEVVE